MRADRQREKWHVPDCLWKCDRLYHTGSLSVDQRGCSDDGSPCCTGGSGETAGGTGGSSSGGTGSAAGGTGAAGSNAAGSSAAGSTGTGGPHSGGQRQRHLRRGLPHGTDGECSRWNGSMARYGLCGMLWRWRGLAFHRPGEKGRRPVCDARLSDYS